MTVLLTLSWWRLMSCQTCRRMMRGWETMSEQAAVGQQCSTAAVADPGSPMVHGIAAVL
jgi:hypothetical protein